MTSKQRQKLPTFKQQCFNPSSRKTKDYNEKQSNLNFNKTFNIYSKHDRKIGNIDDISSSNDHVSLSITNQKSPNQKSAYQLYGQRQSTRMVGSMLSRLSKSDRKRVDDLQKETEKKRREKQNQRMNRFRQTRIEEIQSMRQTYIQKSKWDRHEGDRTNNEINKSLDQQDIPSYKKVRQSGLDNWNNTPSVKSLPEIPKEQNNNDDTSMRELIDWLENVDVAGIDDFI